MPVLDFFVRPDQDMLSETVLSHGEIVTRVLIPSPPFGARSIYLKVKERQAYDFALASIGAYIEIEEDTVSRARFVLGGVAPVPHPLPQVSDAVEGADLEAVDPVSLGHLAVRDARPMADNGYKVRMAANLVARAVRALLGGTL